MAEDKRPGTGQERRRGKTPGRRKSLTKPIKNKKLAKKIKEFSLSYADVASAIRWVNPGKIITVWHFLVETDEPRADAEQDFTSAVQECVNAVWEAHKQMQSNRGEINRLREETRRLLAELKAA